MPTENEKKYVLLKKQGLESKIKKHAFDFANIEQGYLIQSDVSVRIRKYTSPTGDNKRELTVKCDSNNRTIEVETPIGKKDFDDLWKKTFGSIVKTRYYIKRGGLVWEVDFFKDHNSEDYFVMAEVELPEDQEDPEIVPEIITENLIYEVPKKDGRFSNKRLGNIHYATAMYSEVSSDLA